MGILDFKNALIAECASDCSDLRATAAQGMYLECSKILPG